VSAILCTSPTSVRAMVPAMRSLSAPAMPLGEQLLSAGLITPGELESALKEQERKPRRLGEVLSGLGFIEEDSLLPFLGQQLNVPSARLREGLVDPQVVRLIPRPKAELFGAIAMFRVRDELTVGMTEPQNLQQLDELERVTGLRIRPVLVLRSAVDKLIERCYQADYAVDAVTADLEGGSVEVQNSVDLDLQRIESLADGSPIVNLVNYIVVHAVRQGASDIHVEPSQKHTTIRFRVDGQLREVLRPRRDFHPAIISRLKVMAKMDIAEHRAAQDGRVHVLVEGREIDLRVSSLPTVLGEKIVLRVLDRSSVTFNLDRLGVPDSLLDQVKRMLARPHGLLLVTGPTGSGKTTTLYSAMELIKSTANNILTVEDPVEYQLEQINQVQVGGGKAMSFANVLRAMLRQDPDIIMVGEIRDAETAEIAIQAALTGHLVLSTLHTNDSVSAVTRLLDMGVAPYKIAAALVGVIAQRLIRTICPHCRMNYYPTAEMLDVLRYDGDRRRQFQRGEGCRKCFDTGFHGRIAIYEVFEATPKVRDIIGHSPDVELLREEQRRMKATTLLEEGLHRAEEGKTSLEEVMRVALFD